MFSEIIWNLHCTDSLWASICSFGVHHVASKMHGWASRTHLSTQWHGDPEGHRKTLGQMADYASVGYGNLYRHNPHILGNYTKRTNFPLQQDIEPEPRFDMSLAAWLQICGASSRRGPWQINMDVHIRYESNLLRSIKAKDWMDPTTSQHNSRTNFADRLSLAAAKDCFQCQPWWWLNKAITCTDFDILHWYSSWIFWRFHSHHQVHHFN